MSQIIDLSQGIETGQRVYPGSTVTLDRKPPYPVHGPAKEFDYYRIENLTQIDRLAAKRFRFAGFPLKLIEANGAPYETLLSWKDHLRKTETEIYKNL